MKNIFFFIALSLILSACEKTVESSSLTCINQVYYLNNAPFTGVSLGHYCNDKLFYKTNFKNGRENGFFTIYSPTGSIQLKHCYKNGFLNGEQLVFYNDGTVFQRTNYINGQLSGYEFEYYEDGKVHFKRKYLNWKLISPIIEYSDTGSIISIKK